MIHVVTCFWNARDYLSGCLESIKMQSKSEYVVHLVDDMSSDGGDTFVANSIEGDQRFRLSRNESKKYKLKSLDDLISDISLMDDEDIVVELDGDDKFAHQNVIARVSELYNDPRLMICNARYIFPDGGLGYSWKANIPELRYSPFCFSHLRTWRVGLWRRVNKRYFVDPLDGEYFKTAVDVAYSLPMLELAGVDGYAHCEEVMVVYNNQNPKNSHKADSAVGGISVQNSCAIRARLLNFSNNPYFDKDRIKNYIGSDPRFNQSSPA